MSGPRVSSPERVVVLIVGVIVVAVIVSLVAVLVPRFPTSERGMTCMNNLSQLGQAYLKAVETRRFNPKLRGSAQILSWLGPWKEGQERVMICPGDNVAMPETADERAPFHPADAKALAAARGLGSYAVRDFERFPIDPASKEKQIILCDRQGADGRTMHHKNVIIVAYAEGDTQKLDREQLGLRPDEPIVVGPDSPVPELRKLERP